VTSFQHCAQGLYSYFRHCGARVANAFRNLAEGGTPWHSATSKRYDDISTDSFAALMRAFQQRHLLAHTQGLVDGIASPTGDTAYRVGQMIVMRDGAVRETLTIVERSRPAWPQTRRSRRGLTLFTRCRTRRVRVR
jgi:hypothetical protein